MGVPTPLQFVNFNVRGHSGHSRKSLLKVIQFYIKKISRCLTLFRRFLLPAHLHCASFKSNKINKCPGKKGRVRESNKGRTGREGCVCRWRPAKWCESDLYFNSKMNYLAHFLIPFGSVSPCVYFSLWPNLKF